MSDFEPEEAWMRQLFTALRSGWRTRINLPARVRRRLDDDDERFASPAADRWVGRSVLNLVNLVSFLAGADTRSTPDAQPAPAEPARSAEPTSEPPPDPTA